MKRSISGWLYLGILALMVLAFVSNTRDVDAQDNHRGMIAEMAKSTHVIFEGTIVGANAKCSATAIGPHALLTATHCELGVNNLMIDEGEAQILAVERDQADHTIYLIDGTFTNWATLSSDIQVGDDVFIIGNPEENENFFRRGYVVRIQPLSEGLPGFNEIIMDMNTYEGDSGAGIFNKAGQVVSVESTTRVLRNDRNPMTAKFAGALAFRFTDKQIQDAVNFQGK